ncbi:MAG: hypothetical protein WDN46_06615 [Methylocella sp.]
MARRSQRVDYPNPEDAATAVKAMRDCRDAVIKAFSMIKIGSPLDQAVNI